MQDALVKKRRLSKANILTKNVIHFQRSQSILGLKFLMIMLSKSRQNFIFTLFSFLYYINKSYKNNKYTK